MQNYVIDVIITFVLSYLFYCLVECPIVNIMNLMQGRIFYDVDRYDPKSSGKKVEAKDRNENPMTFPENIVVDNYQHNNHNHQHQQQDSSAASWTVGATDNGGVRNEAFEMEETSSDQHSKPPQASGHLDAQSLNEEEIVSSKL